MIEQYKLNGDSPRKDSEEETESTVAETTHNFEVKNTLEESIGDSLKRDALIVYSKLRIVANPFSAPSLFIQSADKWELIGPFLFVLIFSLFANKICGFASRLQL